MAIRVVSTQNTNAGSFQSHASSRRYAAYSHFTIATDCDRLYLLDYNWVSANGGETSATNAFEIIGREVQIASTSVSVTWGGSTSHTVAINATDDLSDAIHCSSFGLTKFSAGQIVMVKEIIDTGALSGKLPISTSYDKRAYTAITCQFVGYDPAATTPSSISATGVFTVASGAAFPVVLNACYRPMLLGTPLAESPSIMVQGDSQIAGTGDTTSGGTFQYGIGVFQKSTNYTGSKLMPSINLGRPGNFITSVIGANTKWRPLMKYVTHFWAELGLNDANTGGSSVATQKANKLTLINLAKAEGLKIILSTMTPITTGAWALADGSDQTTSAKTADINDINAWLYTQVPSVADYIIAYGEPVRNATDSNKWVAAATADGIHATPAGINLQTPNIKSLYSTIMEPAHANKTFVTNGGSIGINSLFPLGDASPPSTGLKIIGTVAHGNIITVMSGSDIDFGNIAPDFMFSWELNNATAGADLTLSNGTTYRAGFVASGGLTYTTATKMPVHTVAGMPYNKALPFGSLKDYATEVDGIPINPKAQIISKKKYSSYFTSSYVIWSATNQANQLALQRAGEQVKYYGHQFEDGFSRVDPTKIDLYHGLYGANFDGTMKNSQSNGTSNSGSFAGTQTSDLGAGWSGGYLYFPTVTNNAGAVVSSGITYPANTNMNVYVDTTHQRSSILTYQTFVVSGETEVTAHTKVIDSSLGVICDIKDSGVRNPSCVSTLFDRFDYPKNVQGMNVPDNKHFYAAGMVQFVSVEEGVASCRCEIADTATPIKELTKASPCIPIFWSSHLLQILILEGIFWDQSLSGKWLHFYGAFNVFLGAKQIP